MNNVIRRSNSERWGMLNLLPATDLVYLERAKEASDVLEFLAVMLGQALHRPALKRTTPHTLLLLPAIAIAEDPLVQLDKEEEEVSTKVSLVYVQRSVPTDAASNPSERRLDKIDSLDTHSTHHDSLPRSAAVLALAPSPLASSRSGRIVLSSPLRTGPAQCHRTRRN